MLIAICADLPNEDSLVANRFGRCDYFVIYNTEEDTFVGIENTAKNLPGGAGGKAVALLGKHNVNIVLSPEVGPKAMDALDAFEIKAYLYEEGCTVSEALKNYLDGKLNIYLKSTHKGHR